MGPRYLADIRTYSDLSYADNQNARTIISLLTKKPRTYTETMNAARNLGVAPGTFKDNWSRLKEDGAILPERLEPEGPVFRSVDAEARRLARDTTYARILEQIDSGESFLNLLGPDLLDKSPEAEKRRAEREEQRARYDRLRKETVKAWENGEEVPEEWRAEEVKEYVKVRRQLLGLDHYKEFR